MTGYSLLRFPLAIAAFVLVVTELSLGAGLLDVLRAVLPARGRSSGSWSPDRSGRSRWAA
jgi:hypothetical protein